jgi:hypothetical protein
LWLVLNQGRVSMSRHRRFIAIAGVLGLVTLVLAPLGTVADTGETKVKPGMNFFSINDDIRLGRQASMQVEEQMPMVNDPVVQRWADEFGRHLASYTTMPNLPWQFRVTNSAQVNAFALPGGFVYINRGLIEKTDRESELAGVIGHEMAHVTLRHSTNQLSKKLLATAPLAVLSGAGGGGWAMSQMGGVGLSMAFLKFSRTDETQADIVGTQTMVKAGYDPQGMVRIFQKLEQLTAGRNNAEFLSDHPNPGNRIKRIEQEITYLKTPASPADSSPLYFEAKAHLRDLPFVGGPSPRPAGYGRGNPGGNPGGGYPGGNPGGYPGGGYPGGNPGGYPGGGYPGGNPGGYPGGGYPGGSPGGNPGGGYPGGNPGSGYPGGNPGGGYPGGSPGGGYPGGNPGGYPGGNRGSYPGGNSGYRGEPPSSTFSTYRSSDGSFSVDYPDNWRSFANANRSVTIAPEWAMDGSEITRGAIVSYFDPRGPDSNTSDRGSRDGSSSQDAAGLDLDQALNTIISQLKQTNGYLREERGARYSGRLAGEQALATFLVGRTDQGTQERDWVIVRPIDQGIIYMLFVAPYNEFKQLQPTYQQMIRSFQMRDRTSQ